MAHSLPNDREAAAWENTTLGMVAEFINGDRGKNYPSSLDRVEKGVPFINTGHIEANGRLSDDRMDFITRERFDRLASGKVRPGDIVYCLRGSTIGKTARNHYGEGAIASSLAIVRAKPGVDQSFIYYFLVSPRGQSLAKEHDNGSAQPNLSAKSLGQYPLRLPPLEEQRAIAYILGTLDDKIELNRQMNVTLEAMAQALFKSWFVDFDPVIDNALAAGNPIPEPLQARADARKALGDQRKPLPKEIQNQFPSRFVFNDELGWIPAGWGASALVDWCTDITDGSHHSPKSVDAASGLPMASSKDLTHRGIDFSTCRYIGVEDFDELHRNGCSPMVGDVLIAKDGSRCGETCCVFSSDRRVVLLSSVAILRPKTPLYSNFLDVLLSRKTTVRDLRENYVSGSAIPRIVLRDLKRYPVIQADNDVIAYWNDQVTSLAVKAALLEKSSHSLSSLRDTLLPKLLSGQLRIPEAEQKVATVI